MTQACSDTPPRNLMCSTCVSIMSIFVSADDDDSLPLVESVTAIHYVPFEDDYSEVSHSILTMTYKKGGLFTNAKATSSVPGYPRLCNYVYVDMVNTDQEYHCTSDEVYGSAASVSVTGSTDVAIETCHFCAVSDSYTYDILYEIRVDKSDH